MFHGQSLLLLCPMTYMNLSGKAVQACAHYHRLEAEDILIVHDDLDLPLGRIRITRGGGTGGHKGVASVIQHLGSRAFSRLKMGIGRPEGGQPVEDYVLSPFSRDERDVVQQVTQLGVRACESIVADGLDAAMNVFNGQHSFQAKEGTS